MSNQHDSPFAYFVMNLIRCQFLVPKLYPAMLVVNRCLFLTKDTKSEVSGRV